MTKKRTAATPEAGHFLLLEDHGDKRRGAVLWLEPEEIEVLVTKVRPATDLEKSIAAVRG